MKVTPRTQALLLIACLAAPCMVQAATPEPAPSPESAAQGEDLQPKFFWWGILLNIAFKFVMQVFNGWAENKLTNDVSNTANLKRIMLTSANAVVVSFAQATPFGAKFVGAKENTVAGEPTTPLKVENGRENFQGVHVAIVGFTPAGAVTGLQPVTAGFRTGDRIKLKVLPTFDGLLLIENINAQGVRTQVFPAGNTNVVSVKAGAEIMVPMAEDEFFEFAGATGEEQLLITLRDPRAFGAAESKAVVNRKDEKSGSSLVQETPMGTYPVIVQSLKLMHDD